MPKGNDQNRERLLTALKHPVRQNILKGLDAPDRKDGSPRDLAGELDLPLPNVSYHFRVLAKCNALKLTRTRPVRGSLQHFYKPSAQFMAEPAVVAILGPARTRRRRKPGDR